MVENKKLLTMNIPGTPHLRVYFEGGGEVPKDLSGAYTSQAQADKAILKYLSNRDKKTQDAPDAD